MNNHKINVRLRMVIVKDNKLLVQYNKNKDFYYYIGGHLEYGETVLEGCSREILEECNGAKFEFKKILYIRDFIIPEKDEHSVELFILGDIDKCKELSGLLDPEHPDGSIWDTWLGINNLPDNLFPHELTSKLVENYKSGFVKDTEYVGKIE